MCASVLISKARWRFSASTDQMHFNYRRIVRGQLFFLFHFFLVNALHLILYIDENFFGPQVFFFYFWKNVVALICSIEHTMIACDIWSTRWLMATGKNKSRGWDGPYTYSHINDSDDIVPQISVSLEHFRTVSFINRHGGM